MTASRRALALGLVLSAAALAASSGAALATPPPVGPTACTRLFCVAAGPLALPGHDKSGPARITIRADDSVSTLEGRHSEADAFRVSAKTVPVGSCAPGLGAWKRETVSGDAARYSRDVRYANPRLQYEPEGKCVQLSLEIIGPDAARRARVAERISRLWLLEQDIHFVQADTVVSWAGPELRFDLPPE